MRSSLAKARRALAKFPAMKYSYVTVMTSGAFAPDPASPRSAKWQPASRKAPWTNACIRSLLLHTYSSDLRKVCEIKYKILLSDIDTYSLEPVTVVRVDSPKAKPLKLLAGLE